MGYQGRLSFSVKSVKPKASVSFGDVDILRSSRESTYLSFLLVEVVDDDADEEVEGEEGAEDYEDHKVDVHVKVGLVHRLVFHLDGTHHNNNNSKQQ